MGRGQLGREVVCVGVGGLEVGWVWPGGRFGREVGRVRVGGYSWGGAGGEGKNNQISRAQ